MAGQGGVLVIGGSGGLGTAITRRLARDHDRIAVTYRSRRSEALALRDDLAGQADVTCLPLDLLDPASITAAVGQASEVLGGLSAVIFASGTHIDQPYFSQAEPAKMQQTLSIEVMGLMQVLHAVLPVFRAGGGGSFVNIGSFATRWFPQGDCLSAVPKGATEVMCRAVAKEEGRYGIRANTVAPGIIDAGLGAEVMQANPDSAVWEVQRKRTPLRRFGLAEDIAGAAAFLAGPDAAYITGQTIIVDGGLSL